MICVKSDEIKQRGIRNEGGHIGEIQYEEKKTYLNIKAENNENKETLGDRPEHKSLKQSKRRMKLN